MGVKKQKQAVAKAPQTPPPPEVVLEGDADFLAALAAEEARAFACLA